MNNKKVIRIIAILMAALLLLGLVASVVPVMAGADFQDELAKLEEERQALAKKSGEAQTKIDLLRRQHADVIDEKAALDRRNELTALRLETTDKQIAVYNDMIVEKAAELDAAREVQAVQLEKYKDRIRAMEENGGYNIFAVILSVHSLSELLSAIDDIGEVMESDKLLERKYNEAKENTAAALAEYERVKDELQTKKVELELEKEQLKNDIKEATKLIAELEEDIKKAEEEYTKALAAEAAAAGWIAALIAQINAQNEQPAPTEQPETPAEQPETPSGQPQEPQEPSTGGGIVIGDMTIGDDEPAPETPAQPTQPTQPETPSQPTQPETPPAPVSGTATGTFLWPVPCSRRVTSRFGMRVHPITGKTTMHYGIDIDGYGRDGYAIVASDGGKVAFAGYDSSYGNYVIIDHGNKRQTLYAHCSGLAVSNQQVVSQGDTIGYLGATGWATGTHCHFEIFINGSRVDPAGYFSGLEFYDC